MRAALLESIRSRQEPKEPNKLLRRVLQHRGPLEEVRALVAAHPNVLHEVFVDSTGTGRRSIISGNSVHCVHGMLPLHASILAQAPAEVTLFLLESYPGAASVAASDGRIPLHFAASNKLTTEEVVSALLTAYPEGAKSKLRDGRFPLHFAAKWSLPPTVTAMLLGANPDATRQRDLNGLLPLHWSASYSGPEVNRLLLCSFPQASAIRDREGLLPLHWAAENAASIDVVAPLLSSFPQAAREKDGLGRLPLHRAAGSSASCDVLQALLAAWPQGAQERDFSGKLPLHHAAKRQGPLLKIGLLLAAYRPAADMEDLANRRPLQEALTIAAFRDDLPYSVGLVSLGADPMLVDRAGMTPSGVYANLRSISVEERLERVGALSAAREAYLLGKKRDENWERRAALMLVLASNGFRPLSAVRLALVKAAAERDGPPSPVPIKTDQQRKAYRLSLILSCDGLVRLIASFL